MQRFSESGSWSLILISAATDPGSLATLASSILETTPSYEHGPTVYRAGRADASQQDVDLITSSSATVNL